MSDMNNYLEEELGDYLLRGQALSVPTNLYVALCSGVPNDSHTGTNLPELVGGNGYERKPIVRTTNEWSNSTQITESGTFHNITAVAWTASANFGWISGIAITDNLGTGSGNIWFQKALTTPKEIGNGDTFTLASGAIVVRFG